MGIKTNVNNSQTLISKTSQLALPNKYLRPLEHQKFKIIGSYFQSVEKGRQQNVPRSTVAFVLKFFQNFWGVLGFIILIGIISLSLIFPLFSQDPNATAINDKYLSFGQKGHIFGTDELGRDLWARLWTGMRFSLGLSAFVTIADISAGITFGVLMGKFKRFDKVMQNGLKILTNIPTLFIMIIIVVSIGASFWTLVLSLTITGWTGMAQQIRSQTMRVSKSEWYTASRTLGTPHWKQTLAFLPHLIPIIITQLVFTIPGAVLGETGLAFIGLSLVDQVTLGTLITSGTEIITLYPRYVLIPSSLLILLVTSIQFIGNATQEAIRWTR